MANSNISQVKMKLLIDTKGGKVLFAEADKDLVDFLFFLLSLPIATVVRLLKENGKGEVGCLSDLYESLENLNQTYMQPNQDKTSLLNPTSSVSANEIPLLLPGSDHQSTMTRKVYRCPYISDHVADVPNFLCPHCRVKMTYEIPLVNVSSGNTGTTSTTEGGFVKGVVTYMVMDNLEVKPMSTISSITVLNEFNVKDVGSLKEKVVVLGIDEGLKLLKASLECKSVLTKMFVGDTGLDIQVSSD